MFIRGLFIVLLVLLIVCVVMNMGVAEGMTTATEECLAKGYTKEFCLQNPMVGSCLCHDGSMGVVIPGFKGECVCGRGSFNIF
jgi:hypothetical protein